MNMRGRDRSIKSEPRVTSMVRLAVCDRRE